MLQVDCARCCGDAWPHACSRCAHRRRRRPRCQGQRRVSLCAECNGRAQSDPVCTPEGYFCLRQVHCAHVGGGARSHGCSHRTHVGRRRRQCDMQRRVRPTTRGSLRGQAWQTCERGTSSPTPLPREPLSRQATAHTCAHGQGYCGAHRACPRHICRVRGGRA